NNPESDAVRGLVLEVRRALSGAGGRGAHSEGSSSDRDRCQLGDDSHILSSGDICQMGSKAMEGASIGERVIDREAGEIGREIDETGLGVPISPSLRSMD
ncbi:unnamed protein product, partial [Ilex paraguariensis]